MKALKDNTALVPFILFAIFGGIIIYAIWKGTEPMRIAKAEND